MMDGRKGVTVADLARKYDRAEVTVRRWTRDSDFPAPMGKRGNASEYDEAAVDAVIRRKWIAPTPEAEGSPDDLLTVAEIARYIDRPPKTVSSYVARGQWGEPDHVDATGRRYWYRRTVDARRATVKRRRAGR